eukprot:11439764-Karenia_brevis.AAC.1
MARSTWPRPKPWLRTKLSRWALLWLPASNIDDGQRNQVSLRAKNRSRNGNGCTEADQGQHRGVFIPSLPRGL